MQPSLTKGPSTGTVPAYDLDVVDEAIVNAVAHRDYAIAGSKIRLFLFADHLELYSPGRLPTTSTLDDMPYRTVTRSFSSASRRGSAANARGRCFWNPAGKAFGKSSKTARPIPAAVRRTSCSATSSG